jgi:nicotinamide mononucleotide (NMN) deamidase PncC
LGSEFRAGQLAANPKRPILIATLTKLNDTNQHALIERIHASGTQLLLAATGGGSGAISALLEVPGASASVLGAIVPYAQSALTNWLGGPLDQACSDPTARAMAMRAFEVARGFSTAGEENLCGVGVTASLVSNRPKRGPHRVHVAWQSADTTGVISCELLKGARSRGEEERIATCLVLDAVAEACGLETTPLAKLAPEENISHRVERAPREWTELLLGRRRAVTVPGAAESTSTTRPVVLFPGAFNPHHEGHRQMAEVAAERCGAKVTFELSIANVDKPSLDFIEIRDRLKNLSPRPVLLTRAATFVEKARIAPGCVFVVGIDTVERIAEPRYYGDDAAARDAAVAEIALQGCRLLVFGRRQGAQFRALADTSLPPALRALCDEVPEAEFRADVSSTQVRSQVSPFHSV